MGAGKIGSYMAKQLSEDHNVTVVDKNGEALKPLSNVTKICTNYRSSSVPLDKCDLAVNALPGTIGYDALEHIIENKKDCVDISFCEEHILNFLQQKAIESGSRALIDFGVAPGLSHIPFGYYNSRFKILSYKIYVGGNPQKKYTKPPWYYVPTFSPKDVEAEYTRPARIIRDNRVIELDALSEEEEVRFTYKYAAFNTDGARTLLRHTHVKNIVEKTLRWPEHLATVNMLRQTGVLEDALYKSLCLQENSMESYMDEVMLLIEIEYEDMTGDICSKKYFMSMTGDQDNSAMAKSTGQTCMAGINLILKNHISKPGIYAPDDLNDQQIRFVLDYLKTQGIMLK